MRTLLILLSLCLYATPAAADCEPPPYECDIRFDADVAGECIVLKQDANSSCAIFAKNFCASGTLYITTRDGEFELPPSLESEVAIYNAISDAPPMTYSIAWRVVRSGIESSGTRTADLRSKKPVGGGCDDSDPFCAASAPRTPAAPLTALLPLMVGLLAWRRRTV
jgi:hypothetical protein